MKTEKLFLLDFLTIFLCLSNACVDRRSDLNPEIPFLSVSTDGHYLCRKGKSFFWMADTGWLLFTQPPDDVEMYIKWRRSLI